MTVSHLRNIISISKQNTLTLGLKMTKSEIFKKAHALTKKTIQKGDNYQATFALCLAHIYSQAKAGMVGSEKQIKWAEKLKKDATFYLKRLINLAEKGVENTSPESKNHSIFKNMHKALNDILSNNDAKFWIEQANDWGHDFETQDRLVCQLVKASLYADPRMRVQATVQQLTKHGYNI